MKSMPELKEDISKSLSLYPKIEEFFKESLEQRIALDDSWIENALVHVVLSNDIPQDFPLQILIDTLSADEENFKILKSKLRAQDDYDKKMNDVLAELNGYFQLKKSGFKEITALCEDNKQKRPDFSAEKDGLYYLFEVKNLRSPVDLFNILLDKYYARKLRFPEIYSKLSFHLTPSNSWGNFIFDPKKPSALYNDCISWFTSVFEAIESSNSFNSVIVQSFESTFENEIFRIDCTVGKEKFPGMIFGFKRAICINDPQTRRDYLYPFIWKIINKTGDGINQLLESDKANTRMKYLLINWQGSGNIRIFYDKECHKIVNQTDTIIKNISDKLFVKLLDFDTLP